MKSTRILRNHFQIPPQRAESPAVDAMTVCCAHYVRSRTMNRAVNHEGCCVQESAVAAVDHFALVTDLDKITAFDQGEGDSERVYPEGGRVNWVPKRYMTGNPFVEAILAKDTKGGCKTAFLVVALFVFVCEFGWGGDVDHLGFGPVIRETGLKGGVMLWLLMGNVIGRCETRGRGFSHGGGWRCHSCFCGSNRNGCL